MACLIIERHAWETGANQSQLQIPLGPAAQFFGQGNRSRPIRVRLLNHGNRMENCSISRVYQNGTRRVNGLSIVAQLAGVNSFLAFQETDQPDLYDVWWDADIALVSAYIGNRYGRWSQGQGSQYGRGRLYKITQGTVPRPRDRV